MQLDLKGAILIFADGASSGNPGPGGWGAIIALPDGKITEIGGREAPTTNNRMEMTAAIHALRSCRSREEPVLIFTDSVYLIRGITQWIWNWRKRNWQTAEGKDVANADLWKLLSLEVKNRKIEWHHIKGHSGIPGNERVDAIAVGFSQGRPPTLYRGPLLKYDIPIHDLPEQTTLPEMKKKESGEKKKPYSYLSLVGSIPMRHSTWTNCEKRVKGRPHTKFKKAMTPEEEIRILKTWGYKKEDLENE